MFELTPDNVIDYLRDRGVVRGGPAQAEALGWGVSNVVLRIHTTDGPFILKQSRPQLRTRDAWFSDIDRVYREQEVMEALYPLLPELTVPRVLFVDRDNYVFAMSHAPADARVWKEALLAGDIDVGVAERAGTVLGRMHQGSATDPRFQTFAERTVFEQLRIDPFYVRIQERRPEVAGPVGRLIARMRTANLALCHGDFTPKNILVHSQGVTLVDYETAHFGDPTMDLGLFLSHLILKAVRRPPAWDRFHDLTLAFWRAYSSEIRFACPTELQGPTMSHLGACLLARIDGTSPVDYLPEESRRESVRHMGRRLLLNPPPSWEEAMRMCAKDIARANDPGW